MSTHDTATIGATLEKYFDEFTSVNRVIGDHIHGFELVSVGTFQRETGETYPKAITVRDASGNLYVHFCGTKDGDWGYNAAAYGGPPSPMQEWALSYFDKSIATHYEGNSQGALYVTGHSQGGNNAQFVTLRSPYGDYITRCVSLDGPGFSTQFVEDSKNLYGEAYYKNQQNKIYGYVGESDYVSCLGQEQIVPEGNLTVIETPKKADDDSIAHVYHDVRWLFDENGNLNAITEKSAFRIFVEKLNDEIKQLPPEQQQRAAEIAMKFAENYLGDKIEVSITPQELEEFKAIFIPMLIDFLANNPEEIAPMLEMLGLDKASAQAIENLVKEFNKLSPEDRKAALDLLAKSATIENGKINIDLNNADLPANWKALLPLLPVTWETALHRPQDLLALLNQFGVDQKIKEWILENPGLAIAVIVVVGLGIVLFGKALVVIAVTVVIIDALVHLVSGIIGIEKKIIDAVIKALIAVKEALEAFAQWLHNTFNAGVCYVNANPYFLVDTSKLTSYASRIENVNKRLRSLDGNLNGLYWQVGLLDLWDIVVANLLTSGSPTLKQIQSYLNDTANRFETAENKAHGCMGG